MRAQSTKRFLIWQLRRSLLLSGSMVKIFGWPGIDYVLSAIIGIDYVLHHFSIETNCDNLDNLDHHGKTL